MSPVEQSSNIISVSYGIRTWSLIGLRILSKIIGTGFNLPYIDYIWIRDTGCFQGIQTGSKWAVTWVNKQEHLTVQYWQVAWRTVPSSKSFWSFCIECAYGERNNWFSWVASICAPTQLKASLFFLFPQFFFFFFFQATSFCIANMTKWRRPIIFLRWRELILNSAPKYEEQVPIFRQKRQLNWDWEVTQKPLLLLLLPHYYSPSLFWK